MPGLFGFYRNTIENPESIRIAEEMRTSLVHKRSYVQEEIFLDEYICAGRVHTNVIQKEKQPYGNNKGVYVWVDGEFYGLNVPSATNKGQKTSDPQILADMYTENRGKNPDWKFLRNIDGTYTAVIWDKDNKKIHLISDRYSSQLLFWTLTNGLFIWGTELKIFPVHPEFSVNIDRESAEEFISLGIMVGDNTLFKNVTRLPAATVISFDVDSAAVSTQRYWWWDQVPSLGSGISPEDLCEELGNRFIKSVADRVHGDCEIQLSLSGGVDSRAILAALPNTDKPVYLYTFGRKESEDVKVASKYARIKGLPHNIRDIRVDNWLQGRIKCIWWIDGMFDSQNMHGASGELDDNPPPTIALTGLFAEVVKGMFWFLDYNEIDKYIAAKESVGNIYFNANIIERYKSHIHSVASSHIFTMDSYIKNFTAYGRRLGIIDGTQIRVPFSGNSFLEYVYSIPPHLMKTPDIYHAMLLLKFPKYFRGIQFRNITVRSDIHHKIAYTYIRFKNAGISRAIRYGMYRPKSKHMASYPEWLRTGIGREYFNKMLNNERALYREYIPDISVSKYFNEHLAGKNYTDLLTRSFTFEVWLQQILNKKYRNSLDE